MSIKADKFIAEQKKTDIPTVKTGDIVRIHQKFIENKKEKVQIFDGKVIAAKHGNEIGGTIIVRKEIDGVGVERVIPLHSPTIKKIEVLESFKTRRAKLYYIREKEGNVRFKKKHAKKVAEVSQESAE